MFQLKPAAPKAILESTFEAMTSGAWDEWDWTPTKAYKPFLAFLTTLCMALYILAYPENHRKLKIAIFSIPITYACFTHPFLSPSHTVNDTFGRFMYIWLARMSHEVILLKWTPPIIKENDNWRMRFKIALKVLYARSPEDDVLNPKRRHTYSKTNFLAYHAAKALFYYFLQNAYTVLKLSLIETNRPPYGYPSDTADPFDMVSFFRRMPDSLDAAELWERTDTVIIWCVCNLWLYDAFHSVCAVFFVGSGLDKPWEWSMSLFGPLSTAWSVRRYWGKHWHNYIYLSFSSHAKIVTRGWMGMQRGRIVTRLLENTMVFAASGVMHTLIRYIQSGSEGWDCWVITFWYMGQMLPIIIEDIAQNWWKTKKVELGINDTRPLLVAEKVVGYAWVFGFNAWSIPKFEYTRREWGAKAMQVS